MLRGRVLFSREGGKEVMEVICLSKYWCPSLGIYKAASSSVLSSWDLVGGIQSRSPASLPSACAATEVRQLARPASFTPRPVLSYQRMRKDTREAMGTSLPQEIGSLVSLKSRKATAKGR